MRFGCMCGNGFAKVANVTKGFQIVDIAIHVYIDILLDGVLN